MDKTCVSEREIFESRRFLRKFNKTIRKFDTQQIRKDAANDLLELAKATYKKAKPAQGRKLEIALNWARVTAYLYQTINSITKEYDQKEIKKTLEDLKEMVTRELGKGDRRNQEEIGKDEGSEEAETSEGQG